ncbi:MAG: hypothetical protein IJO24_06360 [Clostridia bacterium]|nr:hypothetical protein [Clostridia bacterium]
MKEKIPFDERVHQFMMKTDKNKMKNIIIGILVAVIVIETVAFGISGILGGKNTASTPVAGEAQALININTKGMATEVVNAVKPMLEGIVDGEMPEGGLMGVVEKVVYSDMIVNTLMSISYPLLYDVLVNLDLLEFATELDLYATGPLAATRFEGMSYTCVDKDGTRKPLSEVLPSVEEDWTYMDAEVTWKDENGTEKTTSLWNSIEWGVKDEESFYKVLQDMSAGLRGVLEVCVQGKSRDIVINVVEFLLDTDVIPAELHAATVYNASEKSGYEICLISLFNMLGLVDGEYPAAEEVVAYTELGDIWKAILKPVLFAVEKVAEDPINNLTTLLVNFAHAIESGSLCESMRSLRMDGDYHVLATAVMGLESGLIYNLGDGLIEIIESLGIKISGNFNELLDSLLSMITKNESADMPDMDMNGLFACASETTLPNGNKYYKADADKTVDFLVSYAVNEKLVESVIAITPLAGTETAKEITEGVAESKAGLVKIINALADYLMTLG